MLTSILFFVLTTFCQISYGLKILSVFPTISKSHNILGDGINRHLLKAGHEVTYITPFLKKDPHPKLRQIDVSSNFDMIPEEWRNQSTIQFQGGITHEIMFLGMHMINVMTLNNDNVQKLINDPKEHFDLVIIDWMFYEILLSGLAKLYDAPLIWVTSMEPHWMILETIGEAMNPAYSSDILSDNVPPFTFWQRAKELWAQVKVTFYKETIINYFDAKAYNDIIAPLIKTRGREPPSPQELRYHASLILGNSHVSFGEAHRLPVNYIPVGGFHIEEVVKPLPKDLKNIMDNAKHGVIYFSMGSLIKSKDLPEDARKSLIEMFGTLKQTVIWKFEDDISNLPQNVHILKWAPQQGILAHPNCILFITHGGLLSTMETIYHGVPLIGIPIFGDQFNNIDKAISRGIAKKIKLSLSPVIAEDLKAAILDVLGNTMYKEKVKELSFIFHHRSINPGAEVIHWVDHVVKTRGAPHLRSPALMVSWYQKNYLDLLILIILVLISVRFLYNSAKKMFRKSVSEKKTN